jgi:hypothetical protein
MTEAQRLAHQLANNIGGVRPAEAAAELRRLDRLCSERFENYRALAQQARRFEAECEALRKDAERWREVSARFDDASGIGARQILEALMLDKADAMLPLSEAIDAAMGKESGK